MSYAAIVAAIASTLSNAPALSAATVIDYEPKAVQQSPLIYVLFDHYARSTAGGVTVKEFFIKVRTLVKWQDNKGAEGQIALYVDAVPDAIDADPQLHGTLVSGLAESPDAKGGFVTVGQIEYRALDVMSRVVEKVPYLGTPTG